jgi:hypothetical protein
MQGVRYVTSRMGSVRALPSRIFLGGRYYPAASIYTLHNEPNCVVKFNFGPEFEYFPQDLCGLPIPQPMSQVPYQAHMM